MGYRSEVILALKNESLKSFIQTAPSNILVELLDNAERYERDGWTMLRWDYIKWYSDFPSVSAVNDFLDKLECSEEDDIASSFEIHVMGEDMDDYDARNVGESPFNIHLSRQLSFDT